MGSELSVIALEIDQLVKRGQDVREILSPLRRDCPLVAFEHKSYRDYFVVGIHDGVKTASRPRDWLFKTAFPSIKGNYFEHWLPIDSGRYGLEKAYLNLFLLESHESAPKAFLSLHCDPQVDETSPHWQYKRGPHLHLQAAGHPFSRAHLCLSHGHLDLILDSIDSLTETFSKGIELVSEEILEQLIVVS